VPPTQSGDLVKNFAIKVAQVLKFPISHIIGKSRNTSEQKIFENANLIYLFCVTCLLDLVRQVWSSDSYRDDELVARRFFLLTGQQ